MRVLFFMLWFCFLVIMQTNASVHEQQSYQNYDYPEIILDTDQGSLKRSDIYKVEITQQNRREDVYVLEDLNTLLLDNPDNTQVRLMSKSNHTANFSFSGKIQVIISRKDGKSMTESSVYPQQKKYSSFIQGNSLVVNLSSWAYLYIEVPDFPKDPLFIFADPLEEDVPEMSVSEVLNPSMNIDEIKRRIEQTDKEVIYFEKGIYHFGDEKGLNYRGFQIPFLSNKKYYLPGGTVLVGSFYNSEKVSNSKLYGRGIVTTCGKGRLPGPQAIPYNLYNVGNGENNLIEGIHFNNPAHFCVLSRGQLETRFVKLFGWYHQTDGWGAGENSVIENSFIKVNDDFIKVNDDFIKVYKDNIRVKNVILYKQINGGGIQLGWGAYGAANNCLIEELYVVKDDEKYPSDISNTALISLVNNGGSTISNIYFKNIYVENRIQRFIGLSGDKGVLRNLSFENVFFKDGTYSKSNYIATKNETLFSELKFKNLFYENKKIMSANEIGLKQYLLKDKKTILDKKYHLTDIIFE